MNEVVDISNCSAIISNQISTTLFWSIRHLLACFYGNLIGRFFIFKLFVLGCEFRLSMIGEGGGGYVHRCLVVVLSKRAHVVMTHEYRTKMASPVCKSCGLYFLNTILRPWTSEKWSNICKSILVVRIPPLISNLFGIITFTTKCPIGKVWEG